MHGGEQYSDPGADFPAQCEAGHCGSVPRRNDPKVAGCSMIPLRSVWCTDANSGSYNVKLTNGVARLLRWVAVARGSAGTSPAPKQKNRPR